MSRWRFATGLAAVAMLTASCTVSTPWWKTTGTTACGHPALVRAAGNAIALGIALVSWKSPPRG